MPKNTRPANRRPGSPRRRPTASAHLGNRALLALNGPFTTWLTQSTTAERDTALAPEDVLTVLAESMDWLLKRTRATQVGPQTATRWTADDLDLLLSELDSPVLAVFGRQHGWDDTDVLDAVAEAWELFLVFLEDTRRWTGTEEDLEECFAALDDAHADELVLAAAAGVSEEEEDAALAALPLTAQITAALDDPAGAAVPPEVLRVMQELELVEVEGTEVRRGPAAQVWRSGTPEDVRQLRRDALTVSVLEVLGDSGDDPSDTVPALLVAVLTGGMVGDPVDADGLAGLLPDGEDGFDVATVVPAVTALTVRLTSAGVFAEGAELVPPRGLWPALANVVVALTGEDHDADDDHDHDHDGGGGHHGHGHH